MCEDRRLELLSRRMFGGLGGWWKGRSRGLWIHQGKEFDQRRCIENLRLG